MRTSISEDIWLPPREPSAAELLTEAVGDWLARPGQQLAALRSAVADVATTRGEVAQRARRVADVARTLVRGSAPSSPMNVAVSRLRRFTVSRARLSDFRQVRARYDCDVNDVVLAVIAGALRTWLLSRGEPVTAGLTVRAMAPTSIYPAADDQSSSPGQAISEVAPFLIDLPVGEGNPVVRLSQVAHATESHSAGAALVDARTIVTLSGFAPPTLHAMGTRVATQFPPRQFNLLITNVPGPQSQMYIAGAKLVETYAVAPLLHDQVLAIAVTSYCGTLYFGINADRDAMSDVDVLPELLAESLEELLEAAQT
jgi:WS/DGAT/MGAT family acyltransferase